MAKGERMTELDRIYSRAKEAGAEAESVAKVNVKYLSREQLEAEYVSLCGLVAYYGKLERDQIGNPIRHFEAIRKAFREADAEGMLREEDLEMLARRFLKGRESILDLLAHVRLMLDEFTQPQSEA
jgi:hypothetical protein